MSKSVVTEYMEVCAMCGRTSECIHHLIFGTAGRELSEKDGLKLPLCDDCHNMGEKLRRIHENPAAEKLSKMLGQALWEKEWILNDVILDPGNEEKKIEAERKLARKEFMKRYGKSYL